MEETKWCFVPTCLNSTTNSVNKWFVPVPVKAKRREDWFKAVNRNYCPDSARSTLYCCSDHFDLSEDTGGFTERGDELLIKLKKTIIPRLSKVSSDGLISLKRSETNVPATKPVKQSLPPQTQSAQLSSSSSQEVVTIDGNSSSDEDNIDVIGVVTSNPSNPRKALMNQRLKGARQPFLANAPIVKTPKTGRRTKQVVATPLPSPIPQHVEPVRPALKSLFDSLRKSIPAIASQQGLTREQILDEAIEFIIQMRNKSDKRQGTMHYVMENNSTLTAKIQHLENLITLHEKNEIVLSKDIVDRRMGAVAASLSAKLTKQKVKRI